jgi:hypothetical protein
MKEITELGLKHMEDKRACTTLLGHEINLQDAVSNVARAVEWAEDYVKDLLYAFSRRLSCPTRPLLRLLTGKGSHMSPLRCATISRWSRSCYPRT